MLPPSYANLRVANGTKADCLFVIAVGVGLSHLPLLLKTYLFTLFSSVSFRLGLVGEKCYNLYNMSEEMVVNVQGRELQKDGRKMDSMEQHPHRAEFYECSEFV